MSDLAWTMLVLCVFFIYLIADKLVKAREGSLSEESLCLFARLDAHARRLDDLERKLDAIEAAKKQDLK